MSVWVATSTLTLGGTYTTTGLKLYKYLSFSPLTLVRVSHGNVLELQNHSTYLKNIHNIPEPSEVVKMMHVFSGTITMVHIPSGVVVMVHVPSESHNGPFTSRESHNVPLETITTVHVLSETVTMVHIPSVCLVSFEWLLSL